MSLPQFDDLPFNARPDLTPYLIHLTKNTKANDEYSAYDNLVSILTTGEIWGSDTKKGFIKGPHKAACLMDVPFQARSTFSPLRIQTPRSRVTNHTG